MPNDPKTDDARLHTWRAGMILCQGMYWYPERFDPSNDLCCAPDCLAPIPDDDVPLILFVDRSGGAVWQSRLHTGCADRLGVFARLHAGRQISALGRG